MSTLTETLRKLIEEINQARKSAGDVDTGLCIPRGIRLGPDIVASALLFFIKNFEKSPQNGYYTYAHLHDTGFMWVNFSVPDIYRYLYLYSKQYLTSEQLHCDTYNWQYDSLLYRILQVYLEGLCCCLVDIRRDLVLQHTECVFLLHELYIDNMVDDEFEKKPCSNIDDITKFATKFYDAYIGHITDVDDDNDQAYETCVEKIKHLVTHEFLNNGYFFADLDFKLKTSINFKLDNKLAQQFGIPSNYFRNKTFALSTEEGHLYKSTVDKMLRGFKCNRSLDLGISPVISRNCVFETTMKNCSTI